MGWIAFVLLALAAAALLWRLGVGRALASFVGAAMMLGAAGYALQGSPGMAGRSAQPQPEDVAADVAASELRLRMFGRFTVAEPYFVAADALVRTGNRKTAVNLMLGGLNASPDNVALWTALGSAYVAHDGTLSPPARFAFDRALRIAPEHPGPPFFLGMALVRAGRFREAQGWWRRALRLTPPGVSYRADIAERLTLLNAFLASPAGRDAG